MTQEDKKLLVKDLYARIPYRVKCYGYQFKIDGNHCECVGTLTNIHNGYFDLEDRVPVNDGKTYQKEFIDVKPYLRPFSSITDEEIDYVERHFHYTGYNDWDYIDWLNEHHFDYRGLIEKGLALEAPEGMYEK